MLPQLIKKVENVFDHIYLKVIIVIVALVLPLNIISVLQSRGTEEAMLEQARLSTDNLADNYMNEINARMENTQSLLSQLLREDIHCIRMRKPEIEEYAYQNERMLFFYNLKTIGNMINGADGYFYYMEKNEDLLIWGKHVTGELIQKTMEVYLLQELDKKESKGWYIQRLNGKDYAFLVVYGKDIVYGGWINLNPILEQIEQGIEYENPVLTFYEERSEPSEKDRVDVFSERRGIGLHIQIQKKKITARISIYQKIQQYLVLIYLILIPVMYIFLRFLLLNPLSVIREAHRKLRTGHPDFRIAEKANSVEYQDVYQSFNQMADELMKLKIESYEKEILRQKMELENLQLQIRPHFLLNTFNLIYTLAQRGENDSVQEVSLYLSDYFRYIFRSQKELELFSKELSMIYGYVKMASIRYSGQIKFTCDIDPELEFVRTPPLLIHNFIENSVKHGFKQGEQLHITLRGEYEEKRVTFYIIDDGNGMDSESLAQEERLLSGEEKAENPNAHVGLVNTVKRLKYFYGNDAKVELESDPGQMMCFKIEFPYNLEEEDEFADCER